MIVFVHRATYIRVIRLESMGKPTDNLGKIFRIGRGEWIFDGCYRNQLFYETLLNGSEKRQIIGLLDNLNGIMGREPGDSLRRWREIIGLPVWAE
jgi:hypothetical protein